MAFVFMMKYAARLLKETTGEAPPPPGSAPTVVVPPRELVPVPPDAELKTAEAEIRDIFKIDYAKRASSDRRTFARALLNQGRASEVGLPVRFILFQEAADIAARAGDPATALEAVAEAGKWFLIDSL